MPDEELAAFLQAGRTPIYIGFGSIVQEDASKMADIVLEAIRACGVRAVVSKGWSQLGSNRSDPSVIFIGDCPHGQKPSPVVRIDVETKVTFRMAFQACLSSRPPWRSGHNSLWLIKRPANQHCTLLWRVSSCVATSRSFYFI